MGDVAALEAQIAFIEDAVQALDDALAAQQQQYCVWSVRSIVFSSS